MAAENQNARRAQPGGGSGGNPDARDPNEEGRHRLKEGMEEAGHRVREGYESAREAVGEKYRRAGEMVAHNPTQSVLVSFGLGFGLGVLLTVALSSREESWYERHLPDSLHDFPESLRRLPERISEAIARHIPRSMSH
ncbi:MAG TPA: hypothetical protein VGZ22_12835 [Isosphaeraceae bacterium]|jgi:ElaB/YqjD/DUF883 family membrane-anchored ribosome-binding protein|nr:hypothetical protein [Isosphaeraceae bacterium]